MKGKAAAAAVKSAEESKSKLIAATCNGLTLAATGIRQNKRSSTFSAVEEPSLEFWLEAEYADQSHQGNSNYFQWRLSLGQSGDASLHSAQITIRNQQYGNAKTLRLAELPAYFSHYSNWNYNCPWEADVTVTFAVPPISLHSAGFASPLKDDKYADFAIQAQDKVTPIRVHRILLGRVSKPLDRLFQSDMEEAKTGVLTLPYDSEIVTGLIDYIYEGDTRVVEENLATFLDIGEQYEMGQLKEHCTQSLLKGLTPENLCEMAELGGVYRASELFLACQTLMKERRKTEEGWVPPGAKAFARRQPDLVIDLISYSQ